MKKRYNIRNLQELQAHKNALKIEYSTKQEVLFRDSKIYFKQFTLGSLLKKYATPSKLFKLDNELNLSSTAMSLILPLFMNKTLFKGSGFITKALVGLASGKLGKSLDAEHLSGLFNMVKGWFTKDKSKKSDTFIDYGIPPDSETF
ncbi:hypothetical protein [Pedobacter sp. MW01-1-1]|uniref:hypothetical protein n=1 Tax=Pedobacter sp. MW01-1-1 TaxID=3383027 RepID=UPI003FEDD936